MAEVGHEGVLLFQTLHSQELCSAPGGRVPGGDTVVRPLVPCLPQGQRHVLPLTCVPMAFEFPGYLDAAAVSLVSWDLPRGVCGTCRTQEGDRKGWKLSLMLTQAGFAGLESLYWVRGLIKLFLNKHSFLSACLFQVKGGQVVGGQRFQLTSCMGFETMSCCISELLGSIWFSQDSELP